MDMPSYKKYLHKLRDLKQMQIRSK